MKMMRQLSLLALVCLTSIGASAQKSTIQSIEEYRALLADGNPAELFEAKGEGLWKQKRGPKNATLEQCDLGKGPGVVKGVFVELPRYFADTNRVQDLESRLVSCMETLQGFNSAEIIKTAFGKGEQNNITALATWIAAESKGVSGTLAIKRAKQVKQKKKKDDDGTADPKFLAKRFVTYFPELREEIKNEEDCCRRS